MTASIIVLIKYCIETAQYVVFVNTSVIFGKVPDEISGNLWNRIVENLNDNKLYSVLHKV